MTFAHTAPLLALALLLWAAPGLSHPGSNERIEILSQRITAAPTDPRPLVARGAIYSEEGHYDLALADFEQAESLGGPLVVAYERARLHRRKGDLPLARAELDALLAQAPHHTPALEERARVLGELGDADAALADYERLFSSQPRPNPGSYISAAKLLAAMDANGVERALGLLDAGMGRLGVIPQLQQVAIELELERGAESKAVERLRRLGSALGEGPDWKVQMAELLARTGRQGEARSMLDRASAELSELRSTPARRALIDRIATLRSTLVKQGQGVGDGAANTPAGAR